MSSEYQGAGELAIIIGSGGPGQLGIKWLCGDVSKQAGDDRAGEDAGKWMHDPVWIGVWVCVYVCLCGNGKLRKCVGVPDVLSNYTESEQGSGETWSFPMTAHEQIWKKTLKLSG
jgi:hypothetical protein